MPEKISAGRLLRRVTRALGTLPGTTYRDCLLRRRLVNVGSVEIGDGGIIRWSRQSDGHGVIIETTLIDWKRLSNPAELTVQKFRIFGLLTFLTTATVSGSFHERTGFGQNDRRAFSYVANSLDKAIKMYREQISSPQQTLQKAA